MGKQSQLDKAIANLKDKRNVLELAIAQLEAQLQQAPKSRHPRAAENAEIRRIAKAEGRQS